MKNMPRLRLTVSPNGQKMWNGKEVGHKMKEAISG